MTGSFWIVLSLLLLAVVVAMLRISGRMPANIALQSPGRAHRPFALILAGLLAAGAIVFEKSGGNGGSESMLAMVVIPAVLVLLGLGMLWWRWKKSQE
jgi:fatty acid desaturase